MRILFAADVDPDPNSGAAGTEWQTIQALRKLGHDVDEFWAPDLGRRIRHGNLHYLLELPWAYRRAIREHCRNRDYDVYHVNQGHGYLAAIDHRQQGRRGVFVCRSHGLDDHMSQVLTPWRMKLGVHGRRGAARIVGGAVDALLKRHDRLAYEYSNGVLVSSSIDARYLIQQRKLAPERVGCVPQAPAATFVETSAPAWDAARLKKILHVGGFAYWKGVHAVAETANRLFAANDTDLMFTWVCRETEHTAVRNLLSPVARGRVELQGWTTQEGLRAIYDSHGIFLYPSLFDGFGKVFLEAMARGLCVVGTHSGGMPDIIDHGANGLLVGHNDPEALLTSIRSLCECPEKARQIAASAAITAREYSWDRVGAETMAFYSRLLAHV